MHVEKWMTRTPYCVTGEDLLITVAAAMQEGRFRHAPVVTSDGRLLGIVSDRDLREQKGYLSSTKVTAVISEPPIAVRPDDLIEDAAQTMLERQIGALPVIDDAQRVIGILTATDLLRGLLHAVGSDEGIRIDMTVPKSEPLALTDAVAAIERAGGAVLSIGTVGDDGPAARRCFVRVTPASAARARTALDQMGLLPSSSHTASREG